MDPNPIDVATGARVRQARQRQRMSQTALAEAIGVSFQQVQKYERGVNRISVSALVGIAKALGVPPAELIDEADPGQRAVEDRGVGIGMVIAASIIMRSFGDDTIAEEILGAAGITTLDAMRRFGVEAYDAMPLRGVMRTIANRSSRRAAGVAPPCSSRSNSKEA